MKFIFWLFLVGVFSEMMLTKSISRVQLTDKKLANILKNSKIIKNVKNMKTQKVKKNKRKLGINNKTKKELEKIGFKKGLEFAKRKRNLNIEEELEQNPKSNILGALGIGSLGLGTLNRRKKNKEMRLLEGLMKDQFVHKNSVENIVTSEIKIYIIYSQN